MTQPADAAAAGPVEVDADGFEALRQLVVARHHHILSKEDPIAMLQTVNELLVTQTATKLERAQEAVLTRFCHELELSAVAWKREAKELGERTLEAARRSSTEHIEQATAELVRTLTIEYGKHTAALKQSRRAATVNTLLLIAFACSVLGRLWLH